MRIAFVEIANFRRLVSTRIALSSDKTVFVGANNSGKTSAITALRYFLIEREHNIFCINDFTITHWPVINSMGVDWERAWTAKEQLPVPKWDTLLPALDVWLDVAENELHYISKLLPSLEWEGGLVGVRMRLEPKDILQLQKEYLLSRDQAEELRNTGVSQVQGSGQAGADFSLKIWPKDLIDFLQRRLNSLFTVRAYVLDPDGCREPEHGVASPQILNGSDPIEGDPFRGLVRINEISAQRGFGGDYAADLEESGQVGTGSRKLSAQLRQYYTNHLDPYEKPDGQDLLALKAIEEAQLAFNSRLTDSFKTPLQELRILGYPGIANPNLRISTRLRPVEGLNHDAAVQFEVPGQKDARSEPLCLPEDSNGLGYQNLISMVFRLMAFRDSWMRVGKAKHKSSDDSVIPPLHLVLIEEPEVHLHTQVQQVFIRQAHRILRNHERLGASTDFITQMVVSTHSSHVAHECDFESLRYFRRLPSSQHQVPTSCVVSLNNTFGSDEDTKRFVTRYLRVTHCDLFFADAAVLIEGAAERILVPFLINNNPGFKTLSESYVTWLEIGGSHAHRLRTLIEMLGLTTLIITDIDSCDSDGNAAVPARQADQRSRNITLSKWWPEFSDLDTLLDTNEDSKIKIYDSQKFSVRVAYQSPIEVTFKGRTDEAISYTLEDAIVLENLGLFGGLEEAGLIGKCRNAIENSPDLRSLTEKLKKEIGKGDKSDFALSLLEIPDSHLLKPPSYIRNGLQWLVKQLEIKQVEVDTDLQMRDEIIETTVAPGEAKT